MKHFVVMIASLLFVAFSTATAQPLGVYRWQQQPYCNVLTLNVVQQGSIYQLDGTDDQCGAATAAAVTGLAFLNPNGTIGMGLTIVTTPNAATLHIDATVSLPSISGTWRDSSGTTGNWTYLVGPGSGGAPRPLPAPVFAGGLSAAGSTVTNVGTPVSPTDAANRAYVDARAPRAQFVAGGVVDLPAGAGTTTVLTLNVSPGTYFVIARGEINNNSASVANVTVECQVTAPGANRGLGRSLRLNSNLNPSDTEVLVGFFVHTLPSGGQVALSCTRAAGWQSGNIQDTQLAVISVQP